MPVNGSVFEFDLNTPMATLPNVVDALSTVNYVDFGFDPPPSTTSLPKLVTPSKQHIGSAWRTRKGHDAVKDQEIESTRSTWEYTKTPSYRPVDDRLQPQADTSLHVLRYGQLTPPTATSSDLGKPPRATKRTAQEGASSRQACQMKREVRGTSARFSSISSSSTFDSSSTTAGSPRPSKTIERRNTSLHSPGDKRRKTSLEKNRIAAANCRIKKQRREKQLQAQSHEVVSTNDVLRKIVLDLTQDLQQLQSTLRIHSLSGGCCTPAEIHDALGVKVNDAGICGRPPCDNEKYQSIMSEGQEASTPESCREQNILSENGFYQDLPPIESLSPVWDCLMPDLNLTEGLESTISSPVDSNRYKL